MNKFHKLLMGTTAIVSMFGWNVNIAQAQSIPAYFLIAQSQPSIGDTVQFAVDAIHKLRQQGKINLRRDGNYTFDDVRIEIDNAKPELLNENPLPGGFYNPFAMITFQNKSYYIQGVIQTRNSNTWGDEQGLILIPLSVYQSLKSSPFFDKITITPKNPENIEQLQNQATSILRKRFPDVEISASSNVEEVKSLEKVLNGVTIILLLIGSIALFVGGVGIANITIASVVERTPEIGLRRAIGATQKNILIQFLLEATFISMTGGIIAIATVQGITIMTVTLLNLPYQFTYQTPLVSLSSAIIVGIVSSFLPALRASKLDPVEALRSQ
jgi:ABC-type antimicrobial peptide transport system permease subunit